MSPVDVGVLHGVYALVDDGARWTRRPEEQLEAALAGGVRAIQLRLKRATDREALALARRARGLTREAGALLFVNDRYDLADLAQADGVHLGTDDLAPELIPEDVRARLIVGLSTHTLPELRESRSRPVDYVAFGPVFGTASKESAYEARGLDMLREAVACAAHPLVAIGGIQLANIEQVALAGARAAAAISALAGAADPEQAARQLARAFEKGAAARSPEG